MAGQEMTTGRVAGTTGLTGSASVPRRTLLWALVVAVTVGVAAPRGAESQGAPRQIYLAHGERQDPSSDPASAMAARFKTLVDERTAGGLRVEVFPDGQLGGNRDMARLVGRNVIQSAIVTVGAMVGLYPPIIVAEMPFAFENLAQAHAVYDGPFGRWLAADIAARTGLVVLGFGDIGGFFVLTNARREIRSPADLKGIRLRTIPGFPVLDAVLRGLGATPVRVSSREEFQALSVGVIDGQINPATVILSRRYDTVQSYATVTNLLYAPYVWIFNAEAFGALTAKEREILTSAALEAIEAGRAVNLSQEASGRGIPGLERRLQVYRPTVAERDAFKVAAQEQVKAFIAATLGAEGSALIQSFFAAVAETAPATAVAAPSAAVTPTPALPAAAAPAAAAPSPQAPTRPRKPKRPSGRD